MPYSCFAPVFRRNNFLTCIFLTFIYVFVIVALILGTFGFIFFSARGRCLIRQYQFRIKRCGVGNGDPGLLI